MAKRTSPAHQSQNRILQETDVYLMSLILYIIISKWGISDKTSVRRAQVDKGIAGPVKTVTSCQVPFGRAAEGFVHTLYYLFNISRWFPGAFKGSTGRTELFLNVNIIFGCAFLWGCHSLGVKPGAWTTLFAFISPWFWVDGWLWVQVFRFSAWVFAAALLYGAYWFISNA